MKRKSISPRTSPSKRKTTKTSPKKTSPRTSASKSIMNIGKGRGKMPFPILNEQPKKNQFESLYNEVAKLLSKYK